MTYTTAAVRIVKQFVLDSKAKQGLVYTAGDPILPRGLLGSSLKLSSDPIIQLAEVVARLEGDDGGTTCRAFAWCGAQESWRPDQTAIFEMTTAIQNSILQKAR